MSKVSPLTIELIEKRPMTAVKALATMNTSDAAAFFEGLPTRNAISLMSNISAWSASTLISEMTPMSGAAIISELDYQTTASIMRVMQVAEREQILSALPKKLSSDLVSTLTYPADTVGAKMSTNIVVMAADQTVADAFAELRQIERTKTGVVFIVDESRKMLGIANADELLRRSNESRLSEVIDTSVAPISARARLSTVKSLPAWDDYAHLPVVNRQRILIGALARRTFRQPTVETPPNPPQTQAQSPTILTSVASAFFNSSVGLAQILIDFEVRSEASTDEPLRSATGDKS